MMKQRAVRVGMVVGAAGAALVAVGCGAASSGDDDALGKIGVTSEALIQAAPTAPYVFPYGGKPAPYKPAKASWKNDRTCSGWLKLVDGPQGGMWTSGADCDADGNNCSNFIAYPTAGNVDRNLVADPYQTTYSHWYKWNATRCRVGDLTCQVTADFDTIPSAHRFKYLVDQVASISCGTATMVDGGRDVQRCVAKTVQHDYYYTGLARIDQQPPSNARWYKPWNYQAQIPIPWAKLTNASGETPFFDLNAYPDMGLNGVSGDWKSLWNFAWTYAYPDGYYKNGETKYVEGEHHQCSMIYREIPGEYYKDGIPGLAPIDFFVAGETHDPLSGCVGRCLTEW